MSLCPVVLLAYLFAIGFVVDGAIAPSTMQQQQSPSENGQRTTIENIYSGRGIRYETQPMQYVDSKGNAASAKDVHASTDHCVDFEGNQQPNNAEYQRKNQHFFYRCNNGDEEVTACVGTERSNNAKIPVGETVTINGFWHKCEKMSNGSVIYTQASSCQYSSHEYAIGAEFMMGPLKALCMENGFKMIGCVYDVNGEKVSMVRGESRSIAGNRKLLCQYPSEQQFSTSNGSQQQKQQYQFSASQSTTTSRSGNTSSNSAPASNQQSTATASKECSRNGQRYPDGERFKQNHMRYQCRSGILDIIGCFNGAGQEMDVGQDIMEKNRVYRCYKVNNMLIEYTEFACGYRGGPSCTAGAINKGEKVISAADQATSITSGTGGMTGNISNAEEATTASTAAEE